MRGRGRSKKGLTMLELFISLVALALMMGVVYYLFGYFGSDIPIMEKSLDMQKDARMAIQLITRDLRGAHRVTYDNSRLTITAFRGKPTVAFPNGGLSAANTETISYYVDAEKLMYENKTASRKEVMAEKVKDFKVILKNDYVAVKLEAEAEAMFDRQVVGKSNVTLFTKVFPRYMSQAKKYKGYFSWVDEDGDY